MGTQQSTAPGMTSYGEKSPSSSSSALRSESRGGRNGARSEDKGSLIRTELTQNIERLTKNATACRIEAEKHYKLAAAEYQQRGNEQKAAFHLQQYKTYDAKTRELETKISNCKKMLSQICKVRERVQEVQISRKVAGYVAEVSSSLDPNDVHAIKEADRENRDLLEEIDAALKHSSEEEEETNPSDTIAELHRLFGTKETNDLAELDSFPEIPRRSEIYRNSVPISRSSLSGKIIGKSNDRPYRGSSNTSNPLAELEFIG
jgi:hypothetical protein